MTWATHKHYLEPALDGTYSLEDVEHEIDNERAQFWPFPHGAVVTQVCEYPLLRVLRVWLAGGQLHEMERGFDFLEDVAREFNCSRIEIDGRKGWGRVMTGYTETRVVYTKEVTNGR